MTNNFERAIYDAIVKELPVSELINIEENPFYFEDRNLERWFNHEKAGVSDTFFDGNNGDEWAVISISLEDSRMIVENITQGGKRLIYWI